MNNQSYYVICIKNEGYEADLKLRTVYQVLPDESADRSHYIRVIDETGEDYLFPADFFVPIAVPTEAERILFAA
jgi:hypothetical protein